MVEHDGKIYERDRRDKYRCPHNPCSQWNPDYPKPSWSSDKGFLKHLAECGKVERWVPEPIKGQVKFADCPDCGATIWAMTTCWRMKNKIVCVDCYHPYFEAGLGHLDAAGLELSIFTLEV